MELRQERLENVVAYYGKFTIRKEIATAYMLVIDKWNDSLFSKVFNYLEAGELERFPEPYQLEKLGRRFKQSIATEYFESNEENCYYCNGTGYVPELIQPKTYSGRWIMSNLPCKCTRGRSFMSSLKDNGEPVCVIGYFDKYKIPQFNKKVEGFYYPHIVYQAWIEVSYYADGTRRKEQFEEKVV